MNKRLQIDDSFKNHSFLTRFFLLFQYASIQVYNDLILLDLFLFRRNLRINDEKLCNEQYSPRPPTGGKARSFFPQEK